MRFYFQIIFKIVLILAILAGCVSNVEIKETDSDPLLYQGNALFFDGQYDRAIAFFNKAIEKNPRHAEAYYNRGLTYVEKKQFDEAMSDFTKIIEINPRLAMAYGNRGNAYGRKGQYDEAISDYTKAIEINPRLAMVYSNRGIAFFLKNDYEKAWDDVHKAQNLGFTVPPEFLKDLRQASGRQK